MQHFRIVESGELEVIADRESTSGDFDFLIGKWKIHNRKLKSRLNDCTEWIEFDAIQEMNKILNGGGNIDFFRTGEDDGRFEGMTLRLFDRQTKLWSIYWADTSKGTLDTPVVGSFTNGFGHFYARYMYNGQDVLVQFNWDARNPDQPIWSQAFSPDGGANWEWNWYMYFSRPAQSGIS